MWQSGYALRGNAQWRRAHLTNMQQRSDACWNPPIRRDMQHFQLEMSLLRDDMTGVLKVNAGTNYWK
jgi:hypothetical protein